MQTSGNGDHREVLTHLMGLDVAREMLAIQLKDPDLHITGFISPITVTRATRRELTFFVNGRWVQDSSLSAAVLKAYQQYLPVGRYPLAVIFLTLDPQDVDVNVHPAKAEVRFRQSAPVFNAVQRAVRRGLLAYTPAPVSPQSTWQTVSGQGVQRRLNVELDPVWGMAAELDPYRPSIRDRFNLITVSLWWNLNPNRGRMRVSLRCRRMICRCCGWWGRWGRRIWWQKDRMGLYLIDQYTAHHRVVV